MNVTARAIETAETAATKTAHAAAAWGRAMTESIANPSVANLAALQDAGEAFASARAHEAAAKGRAILSILRAA